MRLFHFSDDPAIKVFTPRPVAVPSTRPGGRDWLNGPLVWAIDEAFSPMYFFPRDCPRIILWRLATSTPEDVAAWFGPRQATALAHIEWAWLDRVMAEPLYRYELPTETFESLDDAGMWVSRQTVTPLSMQTLSLPKAMAEAGVELRVMDDLTPLADVWSTSLHASGVRLRNARNWPPPKTTLSSPPAPR